MANLWNSFTAAPHRVMLFGGAVQTLAAMLWWLSELAMRHGIIEHNAAWPITPGAVHAYLMIYGMFPLFMFGFLLTVFPRWMNGHEIPKRRYVPAFILLMLGTAGFYAGLFTGNTLLAIATACTLAGWIWVLYALLRVLLDTRHPDKQHPSIIFISFIMGGCGLASFLVWLINEDAAYLNFSIQGGLWLFLLPVFTSVAHRMFPFFTSSALPQFAVSRPYWPWWVMISSGVAHCLLQLLDAPVWLWVSDAPLAAAALYLSHAWGFRRSLRIPLLAVLHIGFAWLGIAMLLFAIQSFIAFISNGTSFIWGLAPLHALTIGCYTTILIGMGTRVTLGHSGLPMQVDRPIKMMFAGVQLVALLRVLTDMLPTPNSHWFYIAATLLWLVCFTPWVLRYAPIYWLPRTDGKAG